MQWAKQKGFTVVELLIVIVVIGILATLTIISYSGVQREARLSKAKSDLAFLSRTIQTARLKQNKTLYQITGSNCTICGVIPYSTALDLISAAAQVNLDSLKAGDPWGNPYRIDENEGEGGSCANMDSLGVTNESGLTVRVPFFNC